MQREFDSKDVFMFNADLWKGQSVNLVTCGLRYLLFTSKYLQSDFLILNLYLPARSSNFSEEFLLVRAQGTYRNIYTSAETKIGI